MIARQSRARSSSRLALLFATVSAVGLSVPAQAQTSAPPYRQFDENGVDLVRGDYSFSVREGSIGSGDNELTLTRRMGPASGSTSEWDGISLEILRNPNVPAVATISLNGQSETFTENGGDWTSNQARGMQLTGAGSQYVLSQSDGTRITFGDPSQNRGGGTTNFCKDSGQLICIALPLCIKRLNGQTISFQWEVVDRCEPFQNSDGTLNC